MNNYLKIFATVQPVLGYTRSVIYDLVKESYDFIPNDLCEFIMSNDGRDVGEFLGDDYIDVIIKNKWGILCSAYEVAFFPPMSLNWEQPYLINNALILINEDGNGLFQILSSLGANPILCKYVTLVAFQYIDETKLKIVFDIIDNFPYITFDVYLTFSREINYSAVKRNVKNMVIFSADKDLKSNDVIYTSNAIEFDFISPSYFNCNVSTFAESQHHNIYYNSKIIIDENNYVINNVQSRNRIALFEPHKLHEILYLLKAENLWDLPKDQIDVCKTCEFRYMCSDMCQIIKRTDGSFFRSKECLYNPFIAKWSFEKDYMNLITCGIKCDINGLNVNTEIVKEIVKNLYF